MGMFSSLAVVVGSKGLVGSDCNPVKSKSSLYCKVSRFRVSILSRGHSIDYENKVQLLCHCLKMVLVSHLHNSQAPMGFVGIQYI